MHRRQINVFVISGVCIPGLNFCDSRSWVNIGKIRVWLTFLKQSQRWVSKCTLFFVTRLTLSVTGLLRELPTNSTFLCLHHTGDGEVAALMRRTAL
jgi:hypothetical protein